MNKFIIGLSGWARSGKDSVGDVLQGEHEFARRAFADPMRDSMYKLNPLVTIVMDAPMLRLQDAVDGYGWDWAKENTDARRLLQIYGTEIGREMFGENFWVDQAFKGLEELRQIVFTDTRFPNEAQRVKDSGGTVWRITRPGVEAANDHASEHALDDWNFDYHINNNGTLEDLAVQVGTAVARIRRGL